jgi:hypothetical protein
MKKKLSIFVSLALVAIVGVAYALGDNPRAHEVTNFATGHTHQGGVTEGAIHHSGGTDKYGCHNASVPYHCH